MERHLISGADAPPANQDANFLEKWERESWHNRWLVWKEVQKLKLEYLWDCLCGRKADWKTLDELEKEWKGT